MENVAGIVSNISGDTAKEQEQLIKSLCGDSVPIIITTWLNPLQVVSELKKLKLNGFTTVVVENVCLLNKKYLYLQEILHAVFSLKLQLYVIHQGRLVAVEMKRTRGSKIVGVSIDNVDWLDDSHFNLLKIINKKPPL